MYVIATCPSHAFAGGYTQEKDYNEAGKTCARYSSRGYDVRIYDIRPISEDIKLWAGFEGGNKNYIREVI